VLLAIGWGLGAIAQSTTASADLDAVRDLAGERTALLTTFAHVLSFVGSGFVVFPLAAVLCVLFYRRGRVAAAAALAVSTIGGVVISNLDKLLVGRARPPVHHLEHVVSTSFPSGHATQASAFYVALLLVVLAGGRGRAVVLAASICAAALILGIAISRVYLGLHYPSDTAAGVLLGTSWSVFTCSSLLRRGPAARDDCS
jgi:undecaprenyl-diphosphatase